MLKQIVLAVALLVVAVPTAGCAQLAALTKNEQVSTYDEKALYALEASYGFVLRSILSAGQAGFITQSQASALVPLLQKTEAAMQKARDLYTRNADAEASVATAEVFASFKALIDALRSSGFFV